jgi:hypothetical protein
MIAITAFGGVSRYSASIQSKQMMEQLTKGQDCFMAVGKHGLI